MKNLKSSFLLFAIVMMLGVVCFPSEVQAATSGQFPCSSGSVAWELDNEGVLTFLGSGSMSYVNWYGYWSNEGLDTMAVSAVKVKEGSEIKLQNCNYMFKNFENCQKIDLTGMDTSQVTNMSGMFAWCRDLTELNISGFDTSRVTDMSWMFECCFALTELDVTNFNTSQATDIGGMFYGCNNIEKLDVTGFDTSKVTDMTSMFLECYRLEELDVTGFDTGKVTNMTCMFMDCYSLTELDVTGFDTSKVTNMSSMFRRCSNLTELNVTGFDTGKVASMSYMFQNCSRLTGLDVTGFNTSNVVDMSYMFYRCRSLGKLDLSNFDMSKVTSKDQFLGYSGTEDWELECFITPRNVTGLILPKGKRAIWIDDAKNIYETNPVTFMKATTLYHVNEKYNINYVVDGVLVNCPEQYNVRTGLSELGTVELSCAVFDGWYLDENYTEKVTTIEKGTYGDITLYAKMTHKSMVIKNQTESTCAEEGYTGDKHCEDCNVLVEKGSVIVKKEHKAVPIDDLPATCYSVGYIGGQCCEVCHLVISKGTEIPMLDHDIDRDNGKVITPATVASTGIIQYQCRNCTYTISEEIPKLGEEYAKAHSIPESTLTITDETITNAPNDDDIKGSSFGILQARATKTTKNTIRLKWTKVKNADGYIIYGNKCGKKNQYKKIKTISKAYATSYTHKKLNGKKLKEGTYYKYIVRAYKEIDGEKVTIAASKTIHVTTTGGKYGVAKAVKIKTDSKLKQNKKSKTYTLMLKKNKKYTIKASEVKVSKKIKKHRALSFESGNPKIATVTQKGVVKGKKKGTCYVYAYAQNGVFQKIKVKVK